MPVHLSADALEPPGFGVTAAWQLIEITNPLPATEAGPAEDFQEGHTRLAASSSRSWDNSAWRSFCRRVETGLVRTTSVIDFPYSDAGVLTDDDRSAP